MDCWIVVHVSFVDRRQLLLVYFLCKSKAWRMPRL